MKALLRELRRRNVWRAIVLYLGATWALAQGISELSSALGLPDWAPRAFLIAAGIGFPFWVAFAWLYEITPQGIRRESEVPEGQSITRQTARKLDYWIIGVLTVAVVLLLTDRLMPGRGAEATDPSMPHSIAVLPLANAGGGDDGYFADGLTEEMISRLSRIDGLRVIARTSAFEFRDSTLPRDEIARRLGVTHLLEGTVRRHGDQLRIVVDLVRPADSTSLWSESYNRRLEDVFAVQADIAQAVARALQLRLGTRDRKVDHEQPPGGNLAAYEALLQGRAKYRAMILDDFPRAADLYREAIRLEPDYAMAYYELAGILVNLARFRSGAERESLLDELRAAANRAMALAPEFHGSHLAQGFLLNIQGEPERALASYRRALELAPNDARTLHNVAQQLAALQRYEEALPFARQALENDPLNINTRVILSELYRSTGRNEQALETLHEALRIAPDHPALLAPLGTLYHALGRFELAETHLRRAIELDPARDLLKLTLAYAVMANRGLEEAWKVFEEALASHPDHPPLLANMAEMQLSHGNTGAAIEYGRRTLAVDPDNSRAAMVVATALHMQGHWNEAERMARDFLARHPSAPDQYLILAEVAALRGDAAAARAAAEAETDPDSKRYALALAAAVSGERAAIARALATLREECSAPDLCLVPALVIHACLGDTQSLYATLDEAEKTPGYIPHLGYPFLDRFYDDPRFVAHLAKYHMRPPARPGQARPR